MPSVRERIQDVYDFAHDLLGESFVNEAVVKNYTQESSDPLVVEGTMHAFVDPFQGGKTRSLKARMKERVANYPGLYITDFTSPRQSKGGPRTNESNEDFYARTPYQVEFRFDRGDKTDTKEASMNKNSMTRRVARRALFAYEAEGDFEKMVGEIATQNLGVTDAPEEFFDKVKEKVKDKHDVDDPADVLDDSDQYDDLTRHVHDVADEMGLIDVDDPDDPND